MTDAPITSCGAVVLAGGRSSRMGAPKALLPWRGKPLLEHVVDVLLEVCDHPVVVVAHTGQPLPPLPSQVVVAYDPPAFDHGGPLVGLLAGLGVLLAHRTEIAYLGACDSPFLSADYVRLLVRRLLEEPGLGGILPFDPPASGDPADRHFPHPLASAVRVAPAHAAAAEILGRHGSRPLFMFDRIGARWLDSRELPDPRVLRTCNTPQDYEEALALDREQHGPVAPGTP
jgi:molybdopterin-guanine dinucleotide biosynthesis protein A